jgi:hypothetical protein
MAVRYNPGPLGTGGVGGSLVQGYTDSTGTPGNVTNNSPSGRAAVNTGASSCVVTNSTCVATSKVFVQLIGAADATLTSITALTIAAGSFTVTGNANATAAKSFEFLVVN